MSVISKFSVKFPVTVTMCFLAITLLGYISYQKLGVDLFPNLHSPRIYVEIEASDLPPEEMESKFVESIESQSIRQNGVAGVSSVVGTGVAQVEVEYSWEQDMDEAFLDLQKALTTISQDEDIDEFTITQHDPNIAPVLTVAVTNNTIEDLNDLRRVTENYIKNELIRLEGVADVQLAGDLESEVRIETDSYRLESHDITVSTISSKISDFNNSISGGSIVDMGTKYVVKGVGDLSSIDDFNNIIVGYERVDDDTDYIPVYLSDVATVSFQNKDAENIVYVDGDQAIGLAIYKETKYNTVQTVEAVKEALAKMQNELAGYDFTIVSDQGTYIDSAIGEVADSALMGIILAVIILFIFLRRVGTTLIVSLSIPISIIATFNLMYAQDITLNIMSLGGLALGAGMLVDNAIVVIENVFRHHKMGKTAAQAAIDGTGEVVGSITASTITTIVVFLPIVYLHGASGELFKEQAWTVAFSLLASLLVAVLFIPMLYAKIYKRSDGKVDQKESVSIELNGYGKFLDKALNYRFPIVLCALLLMTAGYFMVTSMGSEFMPKGNSNEISIGIELQEGTKLERTAAAAATIEELIEEAAGENLKHIYTHVGPANSLGAGENEIFEGDNSAYIKVVLKPESTISSATIIESLAAVVGKSDDISITFDDDQTALSSILGTTETAIVVEVRGEELDVITELIASIKEDISEVKGLANISTSIENGSPEIDIVVDRYNAGINGLSVSEIVSQVSSSLQGQDIGDIQLDGELKDITVKLPDLSISDLKNIEIESDDGIVRLDEVATIESTLAPKQINRRDQTRLGLIYADIEDQYVLDQVVAELDKKLSEVDMPTRYYYKITGEEEQRSESMSSLTFAMWLSLLLVYMVLASQFESLIHPFTIILTIPLAVVGGISLFWITGQSLNMMAIIGIIMLVGIAVNNSIILVDRINQLKRAGEDVKKAIVLAAQQRVRPIVMTTLTTVLALLPMTIGFGESASLRSPMALAVVGGLLTSTLLTLLLIPSVYLIFDRKPKA